MKLRLGMWIINIAVGIVFGVAQLTSNNPWDIIGWFLILLNLSIGGVNFYYGVYLKDWEDKKQKTLNDYLRTL